MVIVGKRGAFFTKTFPAGLKPAVQEKQLAQKQRTKPPGLGNARSRRPGLKKLLKIGAENRWRHFRLLVNIEDVGQAELEGPLITVDVPGLAQGDIVGQGRP